MDELIVHQRFGEINKRKFQCKSSRLPQLNLAKCFMLIFNLTSIGLFNRLTTPTLCDQSFKSLKTLYGEYI